MGGDAADNAITDALRTCTRNLAFCKIRHGKIRRSGENFRFFLSLPLAELRELRPQERERLIGGLRKAGIA